MGDGLVGISPPLGWMLTPCVDGNLNGYHKKKYVCKVRAVA